MNSGLFSGVLIAFAAGAAAVSLLWPAAGRTGAALSVFRLALAMGVGQGITACMMFVFLVVHGRVDRTYIFFELLLLLILLGLYVWTRRRRVAETARPRPFGGSTSVWLDGLLALALGVAVVAAMTSIGILVHRIAYGDWDAWAIYNLRARSVFRGGYGWRDAFSDVVVWSHPDYPPLLPLCVVRAWLYAGGETSDGPRAIGGLFAVATIGVVCAAIAVLRGRVQACIGGVVLLGNTFMLRHAASQYADVPLMFFVSAAIALLVLHDEFDSGEGAGALVLAGLAAALAAWTKNEGALFLAVLMLAHFAIAARSRGLRAYGRQLAALASGALPVLAMLIYFKSAVAPAGDLVTLVTGQSAFAKLADPARYMTIGRELLQRTPLYDGSGIGIVYLLALYGLCFGIRTRESTGVAQATLTLLLLCAGYLAVYLTTPYDLSWHIRTSMDRLFVQVWPAFVFAFFVLVRAPGEIPWAFGKVPERSAG